MLGQFTTTPRPQAPKREGGGRFDYYPRDEGEDCSVTGLSCAVEQMRIGLWRRPAIAVRGKPRHGGFCVGSVESFSTQ